MSTQCFGDLSETSSKYHLVLLTSILATHESHSENPLRSLQSFNTTKVDPNGLPYKQYNHLIKSMAFSSTKEENIKDEILTRYMVCNNKKEKILILTVKGSDSNSNWIQIYV